MSLRIVVTGVKGQLGSAVVDRLGPSHRVTGLSRDRMDLEDLQRISTTLNGLEWDAIVHCGAYTQVEKAESERERCHRINADATREIARLVGQKNRSMLYVSTDYVFDGRKRTPYETSDEPNPINFYGMTKLEGEWAVAELSPKSQIVRTSWVFGMNGPNFVRTVIRLAREKGALRMVSDQVGSPTYSVDLAGLIGEIIVSGKTGIFHATNEGYCSWYEFAVAIVEKAGLNAKVEPISTTDYPTKARRPMNSMLSKASLDDAGFRRLPPWQDALDRYLAEIGEAKR